MAGESRGTVLVALGANLAVAAVKIAGAALTGSPALFAQSAQSIADSCNEGFLLTALLRSGRPPDERHPFGYGLERFFWSLLAAVGIFVAGAGFSGIEAYQAFRGGQMVGAHYYLISYATLGLVLAAEGASWLRALRQLHREAHAHGRGILAHVRLSNDPTVKTVAGEDTVAVIGVLVAAGGIGAHLATGEGYFEGVAAAIVAGLLVATAFLLGRDAKAVLIGEAADPELRRALHRYLRDREGVDDVVDVRTMRLGTEALLVAARIDLDSSLSSDEIEEISAAIDAEITERWPEVAEVYLDATRSPKRRRSPQRRAPGDGAVDEHERPGPSPGPSKAPEPEAFGEGKEQLQGGDSA